MKACALETIGGLSYREVPTPVAKEGEVLLRIRASGICSSDVDRVYRSGTYRYPTILGHEFSGEIVALGEGCSSDLLGKRAVVFPLLPCFSCASCQEEQYPRCEQYQYFGSRNDGGFAEYLAVPLWNLVFFSESLSFELAALCEPSAVALHAIRLAGDCQGKSVAVVGNGTIGLLTGMWAKVMGASSVFLVGRGALTTKVAQEMGFQHSINSQETDVPDYIRQENKGSLADIVIEMAGSSSAISMGIECCTSGGTMVLTGNPEGDMSLDRAIYWRILRQELTLKGSWNSSYSTTVHDWKDTILAMEEGKFSPKELITYTFPLEDWEKAFDILRNPEEKSLKIQLIP